MQPADTAVPARSESNARVDLLASLKKACERGSQGSPSSVNSPSWLASKPLKPTGGAPQV